MAGQEIYDGQASFEGGQDMSFPASRLPENKIAKGINVTMADGKISPRYGFKRRDLKFPAGGHAFRFDKIVLFKDIFYQGKFQAQAPYRIGNKYYQVIVISGVIFLVNQKTFEVKVLTNNRDTQLSEVAKRISWTPAGKFLVLFDWPLPPIIIEGNRARRADYENNELPVSNMGTYNNSRVLFSNYGNEFSAGDPVGNELTPDAPVTINEILGGGPYVGDIYQAPSDFDSAITAMARLASTDSSTGIGATIVATKEQIFAYDTAKPRAEWLESRFGTCLNDNAGIAGPRACTNINADLWFVSPDGQLRSVSAAQSEQGKWSRIPMSVEVSEWMKYLSEDLVEYTALCYFKNKLFVTAQPYRIPASKLDGKPILDVAHRGLLVLEFANVSRLQQESAPAWAGLWTGIRPLDMNVNNEKMFIMSKDAYSRNNLYEVDTETSVDTAREQTRPVRSIIYTREHAFKDIFMLKQLKTLDLGMQKMKGDMSIQVEWKPAHATNFVYWGMFKHLFPYKYTDLTSHDIPQLGPTAIADLKFRMHEVTEGHPITDDLYDIFKKVQLRLTITGDAWELGEYRLTANPIADTSVYDDTEYREVAVEVEDPSSDWYYPEFSI